jgi:hypothetical protein
MTSNLGAMGTSADFSEEQNEAIMKDVTLFSSFCAPTSIIDSWIVVHCIGTHDHEIGNASSFPT